VIRGNLATRPFYNERIVRGALVALALLGIGATLFNIARVVQLSRRDTQLLARAASDEARAADLVRQAARLRATVDPRVLEAASVDALQANELIDRRTFSWTDLLNQFEATQPDDVRIATMRPKLDMKRGIVVTVIVFGKTVDDINVFIDRLEATKSFSQLQKLDERLDEQNQLQATIEGVYRPRPGQPGTEGEAADR
jgi:hypothetical protein